MRIFGFSGFLYDILVSGFRFMEKRFISEFEISLHKQTANVETLDDW